MYLSKLFSERLREFESNILTKTIFQLLHLVFYNSWVKLHQLSYLPLLCLKQIGAVENYGKTNYVNVGLKIISKRHEWKLLAELYNVAPLQF